MEYYFILKDNSQKAYRTFIGFLFFFHLVAAWILDRGGHVGMTKTEWYGFLVVLVILGSLFYFFRRQNTWVDVLSISLALLCFVFWERNVGIIAAFSFALIFGLASWTRRRKTNVVVSVEGVRLKRMFNTTIFPWKNIDNMILKDGLLTIDLLTNKMIQSELETEHESVNESDFNLFCKGQLSNKA